MLFNSVEFLIFFPIVVLIYYALPFRYRWLWLLLASYFFYMSWKAAYIVLILLSTTVDYLVGLRLGTEMRIRWRRGLLLASIVTNLGLLFFFKYFDFFSGSVRTILTGGETFQSSEGLGFLLPVGISFYTFQTMGYTIDVYRNRCEPERRFGIFALFVAFFPQLVAGPIERSQHLLPQFDRKHAPDYERIVSGLQRMTWGFFKKLVIANRLALLVDTVYGDPTQYTGMPLIIATYAFAFQIYCDFSAYSDIAIGAARVMGFDLMENFRQPYYSRSIPEFWQRWHISLSTWFRDYLYVPLGGSRVSLPRWLCNLMVVFLLSGLWHGAGWTFVIWGLMHGVLMVVAVLWSLLVKGATPSFRLPGWLRSGLQVLVTFNLVTFSWIYFRAESLSDALYISGHLFVGLDRRPSLHGAMPGGKYEFAIALAALVVLELAHLVQLRWPSLRVFALRQPLWLRWSAYYALVFSIIMFGQFGISEFIYFQF